MSRVRKIKPVKSPYAVEFTLEQDLEPHLLRISSEIANLNEGTTVMNQQIDQINLDVDGLAENYEALHLVTEEVQNNVELIDNNLSNLETSITAHNGAIGELTACCDEVQEILTDVSASISNLDDCCEGVTSLISTLLERTDPFYPGYRGLL